jgi:integrase
LAVCTQPDKEDLRDGRFVVAQIGHSAGVSNPALHRLRHGVATYLVGEGKVLKAQARLRHRDPSTTLRHYSHATALDDEDVADGLYALLNEAW